MRRILPCVGLALALAFVPVTLAQEKKPDPDKAMPKDEKNLPKDKTAAVEKMHVGGQISGKLIQWGSSDKGFTVQVPVTYYVLDKAQYDAMLQEEINLARAKNPTEAFNARKAILEHRAKLYSPKTENINIDFAPAAEMKVRTLQPMAYDDKGKPKKLTKKELDELKGPDKKLPGYTADASDVKQDMIVTVYIEKKKPAKTNPKDEKGVLEKPEALMLVIVTDPAAGK
jgi:hypothetical protein